MVIVRIKKNLITIGMKLKSIFFLVIVMFLFNCGEDDPVDSTENQAPSMNGGLVANIEGSDFVANWNPATDPQGDDITYKVRLIEFSSTNAVAFSHTTNETTYVREGLSIGGRYRIEVYAEDSEGNVSETLTHEEIQFSNSPPSAVTDLIIDKSQSSAELSWTTSVDEDNDAITYKIELYQHTGFPYLEPNLIETFTTTNNFFTLANLEQLLKYRIIITAIDTFELESEAVETYFILLPEGTYTGDIILRVQSDVDVFLNHNIQTVDGNIIIASPPYIEGYYQGGVGGLWPLHGFEVITGDLILDSWGHHWYSSFAAFEELHTINGYLTMRDINDDFNILNKVRDLSQFSSLQTVGGLNLWYNNGGFANGFPVLETINGPLILEKNGYNTYLTNTTHSIGFPALQSITGGLVINSNWNLDAITGLDNLTEIGGNFKISQTVHNTSLPPMNSLTSIGGDFEYSNNWYNPNLSGLNNLTSIGGDLKIQENGALASFYNLNNLSSIGGSFIYEPYGSETSTLPTFNNLQTIGNLISIESSNLTDLGLFQNITDIKGLELINTNLSSLNGLNLNYLESLKIVDNDALSNLSFNNVNVPTSTLVEVLIEDNDNLTSLTGLNGFSHFNSLEIIDNPLLTDLSALNAATVIDNCLQIRNNDDLTNLDFLSNLTTINCGDMCITNNLVIRGNYNLGDYCGLTNFFTNNGLCFEEYSILENGYNPTHLDIIDGNCSN